MTNNTDNIKHLMWLGLNNIHGQPHSSAEKTRRESFIDESLSSFAAERTEQAVREARLTDNHDWDVETFKKQDVIVCSRCATTFQKNGNKPCKGKMAKVGLRSQITSKDKNTKEGV